MSIVDAAAEWMSGHVAHAREALEDAEANYIQQVEDLQAIQKLYDSYPGSDAAKIERLTHFFFTLQWVVGRNGHHRPDH